jgi:hypothetical protein
MSNFDEVELSEYVEGSSPKQIETTNDNDEQTTTSDPEVKAATIPSAIFNLTNTLVGGGTITMGYAMKSLGIGTGIAMLLIICGMIIYSAYLIIRTGMYLFHEGTDLDLFLDTNNSSS